MRYDTRERRVRLQSRRLQSPSGCFLVQHAVGNLGVEPKGSGADGSVTSALVQKMFQSGLSGTSHATVLMTRYEGGAAYTAIERFRGALGDRSGEISFVHGGIHSEAGDVPFGHVVPGSGTDGFAGASGTLAFGHDDEGGFIDLELTLPPEA